MVCELHLNKTAKKAQTMGYCSAPQVQLSSHPGFTSLFTHTLNTVLAHTKCTGSRSGVRWLNLPFQKSQGIPRLDQRWGPVKKEDWEGL